LEPTGKLNGVNNGHSLLALLRQECLKKTLDRFAALKKINEVLKRSECANKDRSAARDLRVRLDYAIEVLPHLSGSE
jgi:hypothetical protein